MWLDKFLGLNLQFGQKQFRDNFFFVFDFSKIIDRAHLEKNKFSY